MLNNELINDLMKKHGTTLQRLNRVEAALCDDFHGLEKQAHAIILAAASGEALLFVGPPGTAKSALIRRFCQYLQIDRKNGLFEYLLTPFTEPNELLGFFDFREFYGGAGRKQQKTGVIRRLSDNMLQQSQVVFLDEVFNGSSAILNSLLTLMNERILFDLGERRELENLHCIFAATNHAPAAPELRAVFDRFLIRCDIRNVEPDPGQIMRLLEKGLQADARTAPAFQEVGLIGALRRFALDARNLGTKKDFLDSALSMEICRIIAQKIATERQYISPDAASNRRIVRAVRVMFINYLLRLAKTKNPRNISFADDMDLFDEYFTDGVQDRFHRTLLSEFGGS
jgi:MoxR-like ATPase